MALRPVDSAGLDLTEHIRPGDLVTWGQGTGEPLSLVGAYAEQRHAIGPTRAFSGISLAGSLTVEHADKISPLSYGALGGLRHLHAAGRLEVIPCRYSTLPGYIEGGSLRPDVAFVQLSPPGPDDTHSLGWCNDFLTAAMRGARTVIAEINPHVPWVHMDEPLDERLVTLAVESELPLPPAGTLKPGAVEEAIARHLAAIIPDGATLQYGFGAIPAAILAALHQHRDLGLHSGLVTDEVANLAECGALTNARKATLPGIGVGAMSIASAKLAGYIAGNPEFRMCQIGVTHGMASLAGLDNLVAINSALEVDLFGQVNAEEAGGRYLGGIGGQLDFMHAATSMEHGLSVIALPATGAKGTTSRIVSALSGRFVTTARGDVDIVATEHGIADLRGLDVAGRARALLAIADPAFRGELEHGARKDGTL